jgi:hypothetical protein
MRILRRTIEIEASRTGAFLRRAIFQAGYTWPVEEGRSECCSIVSAIRLNIPVVAWPEYLERTLAAGFDPDNHSFHEANLVDVTRPSTKGRRQVPSPWLLPKLGQKERPMLRHVVSSCSLKPPVITPGPWMSWSQECSGLVLGKSTLI